MKEILERMHNRIMEHQEVNGFETIFDFLNEDIEELQEQVKLFAISDVVGQIRHLICDDCISDGMIKTLCEEKKCISCGQKFK